MELRLGIVIVGWALTAYLSPVILAVIAVGLIGILALKARKRFDGKNSPEPCPCCLERHLDEMAAPSVGCDMDLLRGDLASPHHPISVPSRNLSNGPRPSHAREQRHEVYYSAALAVRARD